MHLIGHSTDDQERHDEPALALWRKAMLCGIACGLVSLLLFALGWSHTSVFVGAAGIAIELGAFLFLLTL